MRSKIPAYRLIRQFSITYKARRDGRRAFGLASISRTSAWLYEQNAPQGGNPAAHFAIRTSLEAAGA